MDRDRATTALVIVLAVVVVGTAAAGLGDSPSASAETAAGFGVGEGTGGGVGNGSAVGLDLSTAERTLGIPAWIVSVFVSVVLVGSVAVTVVYVGTLIWRGRLADLRDRVVEAIVTTIGLALLFGGIVVLLLLISALLGAGGGGALGSAEDTQSVGSGGSGDSLDASALPPLLVAAAGLAFVGVLVLKMRSDRDGGATQAPADVDVESTRRPARGRRYLFHGDAHDVAPVNAVYRAWDDLASEVAASGTSTPAEVGRMAAEAGYDADAVGELTDLFREVRYGHAPVDGGRRRRARELSDRLWGDEHRSDVNP